MDGFRRYGIYMVPEGDFYRMGAEWLGWDSVTGQPCAHPQVPGLEFLEAADLTATPRKYGFHGTVKPPFQLSGGHSVTDLDAAARAFCDGRAPVTLPRIALRRLGRFLAVVPSDPSADLADLAGATVAALDTFRAPASEAELARRRAKGLTERQEALLSQWGYPYVMDEFRFHLTLTGSLPKDAVEPVLAALQPHFAPVLPQPCVIDSLCLMGEDAEGRFHLIHRYTLSG